MTPLEFGKLIREARKRAKLTQEELASAAGVGPRFLVELEAGKPTIQLGKALRVAEMAGLEIKLPARGVKTWL
ncbi:MAG TPA: transcriptional regulator [Alphaproteobacteria bacterium]|nr:transcriptional regulator [Alphaproteobacteria bacterium]